MRTPWGQADHYEQIAPGVYRVDTPSHGGYWVREFARAKWPENLRDYEPFAGVGWYEEDCDWAIVALAMPHLFPVEAQEHARGIVGDWKVSE